MVDGESRRERLSRGRKSEQGKDRLRRKVNREERAEQMWICTGERR